MCPDKKMQQGKIMEQSSLVVEAEMIPVLWVLYTYQRRVNGDDAETGWQQWGVIAE
jgi:hypothetical protein